MFYALTLCQNLYYSVRFAAPHQHSKQKATRKAEAEDSENQSKHKCCFSKDIQQTNARIGLCQTNTYQQTCDNISPRWFSNNTRARACEPHVKVYGMGSLRGRNLKQRQRKEHQRRINQRRYMFMAEWVSGAA